MTKQTITIIVLSGIIIIYIVYALTKHFTQSEFEIKYSTRDSLSQVRNNQLQDSIAKYKSDKWTLQRFIEINEIGTERERVIYLKDKKKIEEQSYNKDYEELQELLK